MDALKTQNSIDSINAAAVRHAVYTSLVGYLPYASSEQVFRFLAKRRRPWADRLRFLELRVTPDIGETYGGASLPEIEQWLNRKYGERLAVVPGFRKVNNEQRTVNNSDSEHCSLFTIHYSLSLPRRSAVHAYGQHRFIAGLLFQPLDRMNSFFLLSSAKYGGPRATRLSGEDQMYFTQFEEVNA